MRGGQPLVEEDALRETRFTRTFLNDASETCLRSTLSVMLHASTELLLLTS